MQIIQDATTLERMLMTQAAQNNVPINGSIELLPLCNMDCDMCYVKLTRKEMEKKGHLRTADDWIKIAEQMQKAGVLFLLLTGGEPFLYPEFRRLYLKLQKMGFILTINTNATLIDEDLALFLGQNKPRRVNITLYGASEETYTNLCHYPGGFQKTINGIRLLKENHVDIRIGVSLTQANVKDIDRMIDIGKELNIPTEIDTYMLPATRERDRTFNIQSRVGPEKAAEIQFHSMQKQMSEESFDQYIEQTLATVNAKPHPFYPDHMLCLAGKCSFTINWQGKMRPCVILSKPSVSVFETGFDGAWKQILEQTKQICINPKCCICKLRPLCNTCAASGLLEGGFYDALPNYMCQYTFFFFEMLLKHKNNS